MLRTVAPARYAAHDERPCQPISVDSATSAKAEPCDPIDRVIKLHCAFHEILLETPPGKPQDVEMLWSCPADEKLGDTPRPWVFGGKLACIEDPEDASFVRIPS